jgi:hypothetical protein
MMAARWPVVSLPMNNQFFFLCEHAHNKNYANMRIMRRTLQIPAAAASARIRVFA